MQVKNENMHFIKDKTQGISGKSNLWLQLTSKETNKILPRVCLFGADRTLLHVSEELLNTLY
jgi:hypothetical protein